MDEQEQLKDDIDQIKRALQYENDEYGEESDDEALQIVDEDVEQRENDEDIGEQDQLQQIEGSTSIQYDEDEEIGDDVMAKAHTCLALNRAYQSFLSEHINRIELVLAHNRERQKEVVEEMDSKSSSRSQGSNIPAVFRKFYSKSHFRDKAGVIPPLTDDAKEKLESFAGETKPLRAWSSAHEKILKDAVIQDRLENAIRPLFNKKQIEIYKLEHGDPGETEEQITERIQQIDQEIKQLQDTPTLELIGDLESSHDVDWLKISAMSFKGERSDRECILMWFNKVHPNINTGKFTKAEDVNLAKAAKKHNYRNWQRIAAELQTNRTAFQCYQRFKTRLDQTVSTSAWTPDEMTQLNLMVNNVRDKDDPTKPIPWHKVASCFVSRNAEQCEERYLKSTHKFGKGKWSREEDQRLREAIGKYGEHKWMKVQNFVNTRSAVQCRERWWNKLDPNINLANFTQAEDMVICNWVRKEGATRWTKLSKQMPGRTDAMLMRRYRALKKWGIISKEDEKDKEKVQLTVSLLHQQKTLHSWNWVQGWLKEMVKLKQNLKKLQQQLVVVQHSVDLVGLDRHSSDVLDEWHVPSDKQRELEALQKTVRIAALKLEKHKRMGFCKTGTKIDEKPYAEVDKMSKSDRRQLMLGVLQTAVEEHLGFPLINYPYLTTLFEGVFNNAVPNALSTKASYILSHLGNYTPKPDLSYLAKKVAAFLRYPGRSIGKRKGATEKSREELKVDLELANFLQPRNTQKPIGRPRVLMSKQTGKLTEEFRERLSRLMMCSMSIDSQTVFKNAQKKLAEFAAKCPDNVESESKSDRRRSRSSSNKRKYDHLFGLEKEECEFLKELVVTLKPLVSSAQVPSNKDGQHPQKVRIVEKPGQSNTENGQISKSAENANENVQSNGDNASVTNDPQTDSTIKSSQNNGGDVQSDNLETSTMKDLINTDRKLMHRGKQSRVYIIPPFPPNCSTLNGFKFLMIHKKDLLESLVDKRVLDDAKKKLTEEERKKCISQFVEQHSVLLTLQTQIVKDHVEVFNTLQSKPPTEKRNYSRLLVRHNQIVHAMIDVLNSLKETISISQSFPLRLAIDQQRELYTKQKEFKVKQNYLMGMLKYGSDKCALETEAGTVKNNRFFVLSKELHDFKIQLVTITKLLHLSMNSKTPANSATATVASCAKEVLDRLVDPLRCTHDFQLLRSRFISMFMWPMLLSSVKPIEPIDPWFPDEFGQLDRPRKKSRIYCMGAGKKKRREAAIARMEALGKTRRPTRHMKRSQAAAPAPEVSVTEESNPEVFAPEAVKQESTEDEPPRKKGRVQGQKPKPKPKADPTEVRRSSRAVKEPKMFEVQIESREEQQRRLKEATEKEKEVSFGKRRKWDSSRIHWRKKQSMLLKQAAAQAEGRVETANDQQQESSNPPQVVYDMTLDYNTVAQMYPGFTVTPLSQVQTPFGDSTETQPPSGENTNQTNEATPMETDDIRENDGVHLSGNIKQEGVVDMTRVVTIAPIQMDGEPE